MEAVAAVDSLGILVVDSHLDGRFLDRDLVLHDSYQLLALLVCRNIVAAALDILSFISCVILLGFR